MAPVFGRPTQVTCFFCNEAQTPPPRNPRQFKCVHCDCWNRYNSKGEFTSDEPAMRDEALNARSFARRASPRKDRLLSMNANSKANSPFCHTCQTNQMLVMNLLSNYLPDTDDPTYAQRLEMLPAYEQSLNVRYPQLCINCAPLVDDEIRKREQMARLNALGGWLKNTKGKEAQRRQNMAPSATLKNKRGGTKDRAKLEREIRVWKFRGCLWAATTIGWVASHASIALGHNVPSFLQHLYTLLPFYTLLSILWTFWDPTYSSVQRAHLQGRDIRVRGRGRYLILQAAAWFLRVLNTAILALPRHFETWFQPLRDRQLPYGPQMPEANIQPSWTPFQIYSCVGLSLELLILLCSFLTLRLHFPPKVRLIDTNPRRSVAPESRGVSPALPDPGADLLAPLSLSGNPVMTAPGQDSALSGNPIFGMPSLFKPAGVSPGDMAVDQDPPDPDAMDVDMPSPVKHRNPFHLGEDADDSSPLLRPQRFFPPEQPTGLEGLLERTWLVDEAPQRPPRAPDRRARTSSRQTARRWIWMGMTLFVTLTAAGGYRAWQVRVMRREIEKQEALQGERSRVMIDDTHSVGTSV